MTSRQRSWLFGFVAALFYGGWAYVANAWVTNDSIMLIRTALVQGLYSGLVTLVFTLAIEWSFEKFARRRFRVLGLSMAGIILVPNLPLLAQTVMVIAVNVINQTPNLIPTVAPSILFSGIYGYLYTAALSKQNPTSRNQPEHDG